MLIHSDRFQPGDLEHWRMQEEIDRMRWFVHGGRIERAARKAIRVIQEFAETREGYVGVSWGKDSVVVADLAMRAAIDWPLVHVKVRGLHNPDTDPVRDAFLGEWPDAKYEEIFADRLHPGGTSIVENPTEDGYDIAAERHGECYISGVRGQESGSRHRRMTHWGESTKRTCAPAGWWSHNDVFAYLYGRGLPVHPAYAYSRGGLLDREEIRTTAIGGRRGRNVGRLTWERTYYPEIVHRMERALGHQSDTQV